MKNVIYSITSIKDIIDRPCLNLIYYNYYFMVLKTLLLIDS